MAVHRLGSAHRPLSEINVTPFVDVALVLLIIFMVTAPMMQQGIDVDLPETTTQPLRIRDEPLILTVRKNGKFYLARREIPEPSSRRSSPAGTTRRSSCAPTGTPPTSGWCGPWRRPARPARRSSAW
jgi:biopolymer transport protein ExbD